MWMCAQAVGHARWVVHYLSASATPRYSPGQGRRCFRRPSQASTGTVSHQSNGALSCRADMAAYICSCTADLLRDTVEPMSISTSSRSATRDTAESISSIWTAGCATGMVRVEAAVGPLRQAEGHSATASQRQTADGGAQAHWQSPRH